MNIRAVFAVTATLLWQSALPCGVSAAAPPSGTMAEGKALFEEKCSRCHDIATPLARDMDRVEWEKLLIDMASRGAAMEETEKELILEYLGARFVFTSKCTVCHTKERIFDRDRAYRAWVETVQAMAAKSPGLLTEGESTAIISYLRLVLGPQE